MFYETLVKIIIQLLFISGELCSVENILNFSKKYIVEKGLVHKYVKHFEYLEMKKKKRDEMRGKKKEEEANKGVDDYDWEKLYREGSLKVLKVKVLDMYLKAKKVSIPKKMNKKGKLEVITADIAKAIIGRPVGGNAEFGAVRHDVRDLDSEDDEDDDEDEEQDTDDEDDQYENDEDEDMIIGEIGDSETDSDDSNESEDEEVANTIFCTTRSGRTATTWKRKTLEYY